MRRPVSISFTVLLAVGIAFSVALYAVSEAQAATYSQVVDNTTAGRFLASSKWISSNYSAQRYGTNYRVLKKPGSTSISAKYKIKTPSKGSYRVLARWPANSGYNNRTRFLVKSSGGWKSKVVNQRQNGGQWVSLGTYTLDAGDSNRVMVSSKSSGTGYIIADAVKVVKSTTTSTTSSSAVTGSDIVAEARRHLGEPYVFGAAGPSSFDCSGLTLYVYKKVAGISLPHSAASQYNYGTSVSRAELKPGDLIFGHANGGSGIEHVGIYAGKNSSGDNLMIHAGNPQTDVQLTTYESWYTVVGYKRLIR
ncbi:MAG TPA: NlpC/P60 family protein [Rubrobacteraceae bacterium]|nr:NlpC/P60 family protein [Rubrobacteraceae bacterium]